MAGRSKYQCTDCGKDMPVPGTCTDCVMREAEKRIRRDVDRKGKKRK